MAGQASKKKGYSGETDFVKQFNALVGDESAIDYIDLYARRQPSSGANPAFPHDVRIEGSSQPAVSHVEVKRRKATLPFKQLAEIVAKAAGASPPADVAARLDRGEWVVCMTLGRYVELLSR